jgi:adenylate kinase family enzyme
MCRRGFARPGHHAAVPLVLVAGISGAGKSAVCTELLRRGYEAHDLDLDGNAVWVNRATGEDSPAEASRSAESPDWFEQHDWCVVPEKVRALARRADDETVFLCGMTKNEHEVSHLFSRIIYLSIDAQTIRDRVASRTANDFGKAAHEMAAILAWHEIAELEHRRAGAVMIDATQPLTQVVDEVVRSVST